MQMERREFLQSAGLSLSAAALFASQAHADTNCVRIGMCDWNLIDESGGERRSGTANPEMIPIAKDAHLEGLQVSVATSPANVHLRDPKVRERYLELGEEYGIEFHSVAAGSILNSIPLATEPQSAVYVIDAIEAAKALGAKNILMAFFGNGELRLRDATGQFRNLSQGEFNEFELDSRAITRVVEVLRQIAPRAEEADVALGLENTLSAKQNLEIIERVGSNIVQVYYDTGNSTGNGYDVPSEIRMLGNDRICEIHLKDVGASVFSSGEGQVDWPGVAAACKDIGYDKWYVLETSGRQNHFIEDTRDNVAFSINLLG